MAKWMKVISFSIILCGSGLTPAQTPIPTAKEDSALQRQKENAAAASPADLKEQEGETKKTSDKLDPAAERKKKAKNLLNQCYQEALESEPTVKARTLVDIAYLMQGLDPKRAMTFFEMAFAATGELEPQGQKALLERAMQQSLIAQKVAEFDLEKALEMARRIEPMPGVSGQGDFRSYALNSIVKRFVEKDPERAFGIVREEMARGNCAASLVIPTAVALHKKRPDLAEVLYLEAIRQFDKPITDAVGLVPFIDMAATLFDMNLTLTVQALDVICRAIDYLGEHPPEYDVKFESFDGKTKTSYGGVREYAIGKVLPLIRRLDPDRAKKLEEEYTAKTLTMPPTQERVVGGVRRDGFSPPANSSVQTAENNNPQIPVSPPSASVSGTYSSQTYIRRDSVLGGISRPASPIAMPDGSEKIAAEAAIRAEIARLAATDPKAAQSRIEGLTPGPSRIMAMVTLASSLLKSDPEQAKSLLSDAASAIEQIADPYDRAECDQAIAGVFLRFDQERAQQFLKEALQLVDQVAEEEKERQSNPPTSTNAAKPARSSQLLYQRLLMILGRMNVDDAIARAQEIKDRGVRLQALLQIARAVLAQR